MLLNFIKFCGRRNFSRSNICRNIEKSKLNEPASASPASSTSSTSSGMTDFMPNEWEKKILVWSGKYKLKDIPLKISFATLDNARSRLRIRIANVLMVGTFVLCGYYVWVGKEGQKRGESLLSRDADLQKLLKKVTKE